MAYIHINHLDNYARPLKCLNNQGGATNITVASRPFNDYISFPISFTKMPIVNCKNVGSTLDTDGWVTSAISEILITKFRYQSAQNGVTQLQWIAIGI